jgi:DNA-binding response OmpR family regulator
MEGVTCGGRVARILVVDDEPSVLDVTGEFLVREGHEVETASGGEEALDLLRRRTFDLLITDIMMPGIDGLELASVAAEESKAAILLMSGGTTPRLRGRRMRFLRKPFTREGLVAEVEQTLSAGVGGES